MEVVTKKKKMTSFIVAFLVGRIGKGQRGERKRGEGREGEEREDNIR